MPCWQLAPKILSIYWTTHVLSTLQNCQHQRKHVGSAIWWCLKYMFYTPICYPSKVNSHRAEVSYYSPPLSRLFLFLFLLASLAHHHIVPAVVIMLNCLDYFFNFEDVTKVSNFIVMLTWI